MLMASLLLLATLGSDDLTAVELVGEGAVVLAGTAASPLLGYASHSSLGLVAQNDAAATAGFAVAVGPALWLYLESHPNWLDTSAGHTVAEVGILAILGAGPAIGLVVGDLVRGDLDLKRTL